MNKKTIDLLKKVKSKKEFVIVLRQQLEQEIEINKKDLMSIEGFLSYIEKLLRENKLVFTDQDGDFDKE